TNTWARSKYVKAITPNRVLVVMERRQVVENPERPALRRNNEVLVLDDEIGDRCRRQVELERLPVRAVVEGNVEARLRSRVEKASPRRILPNHAGENMLRDAADDLR